MPIDVHFNGHREGQPSRGPPLKVQRGALLRRHQPRQVRLAQVDVEEPFEVPVRFLAGDGLELGAGPEARLEVAGARVGTAVNLAPDRGPESLVADQSTQRVEDPASLDVDVATRALLRVINLFFG